MPLHLMRWLEAIGFSNIRSLRRGAHVRQVWEISQKISQRESISSPSDIYLFALRGIADLLATVSSRWAEETVLFACKPEKIDGSK